MINQWIFYLALALIFTHELDAIKHHEWRIFAFLRPLGDVRAYQVFTLLHIPLFILFLWIVQNPNLLIMILVDIFLIVHVGLHFLFRNHPHYEFQGWLSNGLIVGAGLAGASHLILLSIG